MIKIYQQLGSSEYQYIYIFYDHDLEAYGIRGCRYVSEYDHENKFSFYCDNLDNLLNYLKFSLNYENNSKFMSVNLSNYPNLSLSSDNITYDELSTQKFIRNADDYADIESIVVDFGHKTEEEEVTLPYEMMGYIYSGEQDILEFQNDVSNLLNLLQTTWD